MIWTFIWTWFGHSFGHWFGVSNFNFLGECISQGTALPQSDWIESWCFSSSLTKPWQGWFFSPTSSCLVGNITPKPPPLLRIERAAPRTAASEFPPPNWGNVAVPKRVRVEEKMEKKRQVISSAHTTNWEMYVARIVISVPLPRFSKLEAHATLDVTGANTISSAHTTNTIWCPPSQAASPTTQAHRDFVLSGPSYKNRISRQTSHGHGKHVYSTPQKTTWNQKLGDWEIGRMSCFFWLSHSRDDFSAPFAGNVFRVHQQPSVFRSKWHGD